MKFLLSAFFAVWICGRPLAALLPTPASHRSVPGSCTIDRTTMICCERGLNPLAEYLRQYLNTGDISNSLSSDNAIVLGLDPTLGAEVYRLEVLPGRIGIVGGGCGGVFNGIQTFFQLLPPAVYARECPLPVTVDCLRIEDAPRFAYRGMMLDVARTWMDPDAVKRYINLLSYHKINKLHLHLSDDEGWRIQIVSHPELTEIGGFRGGDSPIRPVYGKWDEKYGGFYTQEQMRELIAYAARRNIEIIPEIDLPGHSRNIASVRPEIRCAYPPDTLSTNGYDYRSAWCVAREENYRLLTEILDELCALFPSPYIHIGGDEVDATQWTRCPDCRARMAARGIADPRRLEDLFMKRLADTLRARGKRPAVWNEAARTGDFTRESRVYGWESAEACIAAAAKGYETVVMPGAWFYFDMRQSPHEEGHDWAAVFDARKTYGFDFARSGFTDGQMRHVAGMQGAFWSEAYVSHEPEKPDYLDYMCFPRLCALAEQAWHGNAEGWERFYDGLCGSHYDRLQAMGVRYRLMPPAVSYEAGTLTVATDDGSAIRYADSETDEPTERSPRYEGPIRTQEPHRYRFRSFRGTGRSPVVAARAHYRTIAPAVAISTTMGESAQFPYANAATYRGMSRTRRACRMGDRIDYRFEKPVVCREIFIQTGNRQLPKTIVTTGRVEVSYDGSTYEEAGALEKGAFTLRPERPVRAIRIVSTCRDNGTPYVTIQPLLVKPRL